MNLDKFDYKKISIICAVLSAILILLQIGRSYYLCEHQFIYSTDDTYIHMAIGRNLAYYKVWSANKHFFTSSSSSFLYTILLAICYKILGNHDIYPYLLNIIPYFAIYVIVYKQYNGKISKHKFLLINLFILLIYPLPIIAMEHSLHVLIVLLFLFEFEKNLFQSNSSNKLLLLAFLLTMLRYESIFILFSAFLILFYYKKYKEGISIIVVGFLPILIYGIYSLQHGSYFLPNTLMIKGNFPETNKSAFVIFLIKIFFDFSFNIHFTILILLTGIYLIKEKFKIKEWNLIIIVLCAGAHLLFARVMHIYRYEAYLLVPSVIYFILYFYQDENEKFVVKTRFTKTIVIIFISSILFRIFLNIFIIQMASKNIYEQQIQFSKFLKKYYTDKCVLVHDIGYLAYTTDVKIYDVAGIATVDAVYIRANQIEHSTAFVNEQQKKYDFRIGVFYTTFETHGMPSNWIKTAEWKIKHNRVCGSSKINFYAIDSSQYKILKKQLIEYTPLVNKRVIQKIF